MGSLFFGEIEITFEIKKVTFARFTRCPKCGAFGLTLGYIDSEHKMTLLVGGKVEKNRELAVIDELLKEGLSQLVYESLKDQLRYFLG